MTKRRSYKLTAARKAAIRKWQAAGAAKKKGSRDPARKKKALVHGYSKLVGKAARATGPLKLRLKTAKAKLWSKIGGN